MDKAYFLELLKRYREGVATAEEERFIHAYYDIFESQQDVTGLLTDAEKQRLKTMLHAGIWDKIAQQESKKAAVRRVYFSWWKAAAVFAILAGGTLSVMVLKRSPEKQAVIADQQKVAPERENSLVQLPDGSTAIVSPGSRLLYPASFEGHDKREVYLEGKAFFDIRHASSKIFIVHTGNLQTTVLGTAFEVQALPGADNITVTVVSGKVKVTKQQQPLAVLTKDEQVVIKTASLETIRQKTDAKLLMAWKADDMLFDDVTLKNAALLLEERFGVNIVIEDEQLINQRFSTTFGKNESLEQVLTSICAFNNASYTYDKDQKIVRISRK
ncbi:FecR domain-containing protein [uncultured Chitinophaga sp.]|uniref:FecR family protein n=1 Tax=uncultured Chitinophaga sp. TaxID=339340 RepID=UPI0025F8A12C|nr:FecR domain-containing protein [uncultured Chitinophaga sp.]